MPATLTVITGPMFSKKSKRLMEMLNDESHADKKILRFKPNIDDRTMGIGSRKLGTADDIEEWEEVQAYRIGSTEEADALFQKEKPAVIGIDEGHLFDFWLQDWIAKKLDEEKLNEDFMIITAGLGTDYMRRPTKNMPELMAMADEVVILTAKCKSCKGKKGRAIFTERIAGSSRAIEIGSKNYRAACRACHHIYKPNEAPKTENE